MRISDWSSDVCSSDLEREEEQPEQQPKIRIERPADRDERTVHSSAHRKGQTANDSMGVGCDGVPVDLVAASGQRTRQGHDERLAILRSEEHKSELQSLMRISYAVFCLKKKNKLVKASLT